MQPESNVRVFRSGGPAVYASFLVPSAAFLAGAVAVLIKRGAEQAPLSAVLIAAAALLTWMCVGLVKNARLELSPHQLRFIGVQGVERAVIPLAEITSVWVAPSGIHSSWRCWIETKNRRYVFSSAVVGHEELASLLAEIASSNVASKTSG